MRPKISGSNTKSLNSISEGYKERWKCHIDQKFIIGLLRQMVLKVGGQRDIIADLIPDNILFEHNYLNNNTGKKTM